MTLPPSYVRFQKRFPEIAQDFESLGQKLLQAGPLNAGQARLVKLGIAVATGSKGGIKSQARRALEDGFTPDQVSHAALLGLPTIGFPAIIAALGWIDEVLAEK